MWADSTPESVLSAPELVGSLYKKLTEGYSTIEVTSVCRLTKKNAGDYFLLTTLILIIYNLRVQLKSTSVLHVNILHHDVMTT